jgi:hypothetical protein
VYHVPSPACVATLPRRLFVALGASAVLLCGFAAAPTPSAYATWAGDCSSGHHCYALSWWCPNTEKNVTDAWVYEDTTNMTVPDPKNNFVDNEMWLSTSCEGKEAEWIEAGQSAGYPRTSEHKIYPFYAKMSGGVYEEFTSATAISANTRNLYKFYRSKEGEWCVEWGSTLERCYSGFKSGPAHDVEEGVEAATDSEPSNNGYGEGFALGGINNWWEGSVKAEIETQTGTCASEHSPGPGSLNYGAGKGC